MCSACVVNLVSIGKVPDFYLKKIGFPIFVKKNDLLCIIKRQILVCQLIDLFHNDDVTKFDILLFKC